MVGEPNGHIDMFVTLVAKNIGGCWSGPSLVLIQSIQQYLDETANTRSLPQHNCGTHRVKRIPMPPKWGDDWSSYTNVILANKVLLMPSLVMWTLRLKKAEAVYRSVLPSDWSIKRINCDQLVNMHGQLHCISYNIPAFVDIDNLLSHAIPQIEGENED